LNHRLLFVNNFSNITRFTVSIIITFFMTPIYLSYLGNYLYGIWAVLQATIGYFDLMRFGMPVTVMKYVAEYSEERNSKEISNIIINVFLFYFIVTIIIVPIFILLIAIGIPILKISLDYLKLVQYTVITLGISLLVRFYGSIFRQIINGNHLFYISNTVEILFALLRAGTIFYFLKKGQGIIMMAMIILVSDLIMFCTYYLIGRLWYKFFNLKNAKISKEWFSKILKFGSKSFLTMLAGRVYSGSDSLIISYFYTPALVPFYTIPANLVYYCRSFFLTLTQSFIPLFSELDAKKRKDNTIQIYFDYSRYICLIYFPILITINVFGGSFLNIWIGPEFSQKGETIIFFLSLSLFLTALQPLSERLLIGTANQIILVKTGYMMAVIFLITGIPLTKIFGLKGLAFSFFISSTIPNLLILKYTISLLNISINQYFINSILPPSIVSIIYLLSLVLLKVINYPNSYIGMISKTIIAYSILLIFSWWIVFKKNERNKIIEKAKILFFKIIFVRYN